MHKIKVIVQTLNKENSQLFEETARRIPDVTQVEMWDGRAEILLNNIEHEPKLIEELMKQGFHLENIGRETIQTETEVVFSVDGMTCHSCEVLIERKIRQLEGVGHVKADFATGVIKVVCAKTSVPNHDAVERAIGNEKYSIRPYSSNKKVVTTQGVVQSIKKPTVTELVLLFGGVFIIGWILSQFGLFNLKYSVGNSVGFGSALIIGLVAGSSSCLAVAGGLLLSSTARYAARYGNATRSARMQPVLLFILGRVLGYGLLGGLIGLIGKALTPPPFVTGALMVLAAAYMFIMGLEMVHVAPQWMRKLLPSMPKSLSHWVLDKEGNESRTAPLLLGAGTFFLPCGFTQALQLYALTTQSFWASALVLGGFALGTAPMLGVLGWASSSLRGKAGSWFFKFAGATVVVLGLWNIQNGFTVMGYPLSLPDFHSTAVTAEVSASGLPPIIDGKQVIKMDVDYSYSPNTLTVRAGVPVRWEINGIDVGGCVGYIQSPPLGIGQPLHSGANVVEFTAQSAGKYTFSCSMGMVRGTMNVVDKT